MHFNPRSPHGERHLALIHSDREKLISIHAPRTGSDRYHSTLRVNPIYFNPRSPHGERLFTIPFIALTSDFNPRSPHGERRPTLSFRPRHGGYFNPRSPHGERPSHSLLHDFDKHFNPRSPHGERPFLPCAAHAPYSNFNPRSPHGERRYRVIGGMGGREFQSTLPARGATRTVTSA